MKSDQDGIERLMTAQRLFWRNTPLKSDQDGIESSIRSTAEETENKSWNQTKMGLKGSGSRRSSIWLSGWNQTKMGLKVKRKKRRNCCVKGWNQTKMGLKGMSQESVAKAFGITVEIRPRWDWKAALPSLRGYRGRVEIRPRWDWKNYAIPPELDDKVVEIRPRWDWKWSDTARARNRIFKLKSDQDGIEREILPSQPRSIRNRWNQTKMGLKD